MRTGAKVYYRKFLTCSQRPSHELLVAPGKKLLVARSYERSSWHYYYSSKKLFGRGFPTTTRSITGMTTNVTPDITHDIRPKPWASWSFFGTMRAPGRTSSTRSVLRPRREECAARHVGKIRSSSCPGEVVLGGGPVRSWCSRVFIFSRNIPSWALQILGLRGLRTRIGGVARCDSRWGSVPAPDGRMAGLCVLL